MTSLVEWFRSWRLVSLRSALVTAALAYTVAGFFLVPWIVKGMIVDIVRERTGREVTVEKVRCNPFTLSLAVHGLSMPDVDGSPLLSFDELSANAQASSLFRWALTLKELRIERPFLALRRFEDGAVNLLELRKEIARRTSADTEPSAGGLPRALLHRIEITGTTLEVEDLALAEPLRITLGPAHFQLSNISTIPEQRGGHDFVIGLPRGGEIRITGNVVVEPLGVDGTVSYRGLFLEYTWPEIKDRFNFDLVSGDVEGRFDYAAALEAGGLSARIDNSDLRLRDLVLEMRSDGTRVLELPSVDVAGGSVRWPEAVIGAREVRVSDPVARTWIAPGGTPGVLELMPKPAATQAIERAREIEARMHWTLELDRFELAGARAEVEDRTSAEPVLLTVDEASLVLTDIVTEEDARWGFEASALLLGSGRGTASGEVSAMPPFVDLEVGIDGFEIADLGTYIERIAPIELRAGTVRGNGRVRFEVHGEQPDLVFEGAGAIDRIDLVETVVGSQILEWGLVEASGIRATHAPQSLRVAEVDIHGAGIDVVVSPDGRINLLELLLAMAKRSEAAGGASTPMPPIRVDRLRLHDCSAVYIDQTLEPEFRLALERVNGGLTGISSQATAGAVVDIEGRFAAGGLVDLEGEIDVFDPGRLTAIGLDCREVALPPLSPMAVRFIGHPFAGGSATLDLDYDIAASELAGNNLIVTDGLTLGDKVEGEGMMNLPFKLGVSLLTDKDGLMTLEFPIEGNLDDPAFGIGNAVQAAVKEVISELVTSPFRLLAKLGGGSGEEDLGFIEFEAGSAELEVTATDKLATLAAGAEERPQLVLQVAGAWDPESDARALKRAAFEALVAERLAAAAEAAQEEQEMSAPLALLESLGSEILGPERVAAVKAGHTTAPEAGGSGEAAADPVLDETAYYRDLRAALEDAQPVAPAAVEALGPARGEAIRSELVESHAIDPSRVQLLDAAPVAEPAGGEWVRCRLEVAVE